MASASKEDGQLKRFPELVAMVREMVDSGDLGYWLFVGEKRN